MYDFALPAMTLETKEYCGYNKNGCRKSGTRWNNLYARCGIGRRVRKEAFPMPMDGLTLGFVAREMEPLLLGRTD